MGNVTYLESPFANKPSLDLVGSMRELSFKETLMVGGGFSWTDFGASIFGGAVGGAAGGAVAGSFAGGVGAGPGAVAGGVGGAVAGGVTYAAVQAYYAYTEWRKENCTCSGS